jgi:hypothetical protein
MNTRGLTELIVLQAGYSAGILTAPLFLALVVMAVTTTVLPGLLLPLIDTHIPGPVHHESADPGRHERVRA